MQVHISSPDTQVSSHTVETPIDSRDVLHPKGQSSYFKCTLFTDKIMVGSVDESQPSFHEEITTMTTIHVPASSMHSESGRH